MSAEGAESTHYRGFTATLGFLSELKRLALEEITARQRTIIGELAKLGVEAEE
jgi:hypothetical protein